MNEGRRSKNSGRYRCKSRRAREASGRAVRGMIALATAGRRDPPPPRPLTASREIRVVRRALPKCLRRAAASWRKASPYPDETLPEIIGDRLAEFIVDVNRIHKFAVNIELQLSGSAIADPYRRRAGVTFPMQQRFFD